jgi:xanthine dehydrogenase YagR molybdenum-binding subunit
MSVAARGAVGRVLARVEGPEKLTGEARYAFEHQPEGALYASIVGATVARGEVRALHAGEALAHPGVVGLLSHQNAPRLVQASGELCVLQSPRVAYRGQIVAAVLGESPEAAREGARLLRVEYASEDHDVALRAGHPGLYRPEQVNPAFPSDTRTGDFDGEFARSQVQVDVTLQTPWLHNAPMEPHATVARWGAGAELTLWDSTQGASSVARAVAEAFGLEPGRVRVISPHVGGGFGSKGTPRPHVILAALAARACGRPVKLAVTRQEMFQLTGYRTPTIQRLRLGSDREGRLRAIGHDALEQTSTVDEFAEQTAVVSRMMYAALARRTTHRLVALDVPTPSWMRAPGECPGTFGLEAALDELAYACDIDPVELRLRNVPAVEPESGRPFSSHGLADCLREGARRFGWQPRDPKPGIRRDGEWLVGTGVASSVYPVYRQPSVARARREDGRFVVQIAAADIGQGARTILTQLAADALETEVENVQIEIGDSALPPASVAGGSSGSASWGTAVVRACEQLRRSGADDVTVDTAQELEQLERRFAQYAFGAQFVEARVSTVTGEVRIPRALGIFAAGRILNPATARSQLLGGMTMGLGMALLEEGVLDCRYGDVLNHDLAQYHVASYADFPGLEVDWVQESDEHLGPTHGKGIGEIGIVGTAAAVAAAVFHATGRRFRRLPIGVADVLAAL